MKFSREQLQKRFVEGRTRLMQRAFEGFLSIHRTLSVTNGKLWWPELAPLTELERAAVRRKLEEEGRLASRYSR